MLLLVDLDNTLVERVSAFILWASDFVRSFGRVDSETAWLIAADLDGYEPREPLARAIEERFETGLAVEVLVEKLLYDHVDLLTSDSATAQALQSARESAWRIGIVTNGTTAQQALRIRTVGLEPYVEAVTMSDAEGTKKPDAQLFQIAAGRLGCGVDGWGSSSWGRKAIFAHAPQQSLRSKLAGLTSQVNTSS